MRGNGSVHSRDSIDAELSRSIIAARAHNYTVESLHTEYTGNLGYDTESMTKIFRITSPKAITLWSYRRSTESGRSWPTPLSQIRDRSSPIVQRVKILLNETPTPCFMVFMSEYNSKHTENDTFDPQHRFADSR